MPTTIVVSNQKGGVGKTTTCINLAAELGKAGYPVLLVDLDPQANSTSGLGINTREVKGGSYDVLLGSVPILDAIVPTEWAGLSLIPSSLDLAGAEIELVSTISREARLKRQIATLEEMAKNDPDPAHKFEIVMIDCPPSLGLLTLNALTACDRLLVPIQCEYYALEGVRQLVYTVSMVKESLNPSLEVSGVLLTLYDTRTKLSNEVVAEVRNQFGDKVFNTIIPRNVRLAEAPSFGSPITYYDNHSTGSRAYEALAREVIQRWLKN